MQNRVYVKVASSIILSDLLRDIQPLFFSEKPCDKGTMSFSVKNILIIFS